MNNHLEVTKIMVIVQKSWNWDGLILGRTVLCTIVRVTININRFIRKECTHPISHVYSTRGFMLAGGIPMTSYILVWGSVRYRLYTSFW